MDADEPYDPSLATVPVGVAALPQLRQRRPLGRPLVDLELEHPDHVLQRHHHVRPARRRTLLRPHVQPRALQERVHHARVVPLEARHLVAGVPFVRNAREQRPQLRLHARRVPRPQRPHHAPPERGPGVGLPAGHAREQVAVQAPAHLEVRVSQPEHLLVVLLLDARDRQVAGLPEQRLGRDVVHVERGKQRVVRLDALQVEAGHPAPLQHVDQELGRPRSEPVRTELAGVEQQQHVVRVVDGLAQPAVAIVPQLDLVAVERPPFRIVERRCEDRVQLALRVAADGGEAGVQRDVRQVVQPGEQVDLRELGDAGEEHEADVGVAGLEGAVQPAQKVAVGAGDFGRRRDVVHDRLVVLVHQHRDAAAGVRVEGLDEPG